LSQKEVYDILKELGGEATTKQIKIRAKEKFPELSLHAYVTDRLRRLERNGYVRKIIKDGEVAWKIIAEYRS
jgi:Fe2+ or Zn2+ uptake regulation protein